MNNKITILILKIKHSAIIFAKAGIQKISRLLSLDSRFHGNDSKKNSLKLEFLNKKESYLLDIIFLMLIIGFLFGFMLGSFPLEVPDGARYAEIPREMLQSGDYLIPHLNGFQYLEKPPLFYWLQALSMKTFGFGGWALHIVNAFFALLTCLSVYIASRKLYDRKTGILASLILATSSLFFVLGRLITLDMTLTAFLTMSILSLACGMKVSLKHRLPYFLAFSIFAALATMTKGLVGIILPSLIALTWIGLTQKWRELKWQHILICGSIFLIITIPWHILVQLKNPDFFHFYFIGQHFLRYLTDCAQRQQAFWFFPIVFLVGFFPWTLFLFQAIKAHWQKNWRDFIKSIDLLFILWPILIFIFYSFSNSKLVPYILPVFPPLAILLGHHFAKLDQNHLMRRIKLPLLGYCLIAALLSLGLFIFPHLVDFKNYAITPLKIYIAASFLFVSAITTFFIQYKRGVKNGLITLLLTFSVFLISSAPILSGINNKSIKPLINILQKQLRSTDEVASYQNYYQDLSYYLGRRIIIVNFFGELEFGVKHAADANRWAINAEAFWQRWRKNNRMFLFAEKDAYDTIKRQAPKNKLYLVDTYLQTMLLTNKKI